MAAISSSRKKAGQRFDPVVHICFVGVGASLSLFTINMILGNPFFGFNRNTWLIFLASAIVSQLIGYMSLAYALGHLPASIVSPTMILQPVVTTLLAIPLLLKFQAPGRDLVGPSPWLGSTWSTNRTSEPSQKRPMDRVKGKKPCNLLHDFIY